jgi:prevent-host-death family protein
MAEPSIETCNEELRSIREASKELGKLVEQLEAGELEKIVVTKHGRMVAVILPLASYTP